MPTLSTVDATELLAKGVERARPSELAEIHSELFPERLADGPPTAADLARYVRGGLEAEELVDLWNVVFPADRNVRYDEEDEKIHYNEEAFGYAEAD